MVTDTHLQKNDGPVFGENWSQRYLNVGTYPLIYRPGRSITVDIDGRYRRSIRIYLMENTVDIDGRCRFTYGELRLIVDGRLKIEIILWSI